MRKKLLFLILLILTFTLTACKDTSTEIPQDSEIVGYSIFEDLYPTLKFNENYYEWYQGRPRLLEKSVYYGEFKHVKGDVPKNHCEMVFPYDVSGEIYTVPDDEEFLYVVLTSKECGYEDAVIKFQRVEESDLQNLLVFQIQDNMNLSFLDPEDENYFPETIGDGCLRSVYKKPADVDLYEMFYDGFEFMIENPDFYFEYEEFIVGEEDLVFLQEQGAPMDMKILKLPRVRMDEFLKKYMGLTLEETNKVGLEKFYYNEETDIYYLVHEDDIHCKYVTIVEQFVEDDEWNFIYTLKDSETATEESEKYIARLICGQFGSYYKSVKKYSPLRIYPWYLRVKKLFGLVE